MHCLSVERDDIFRDEGGVFYVRRCINGDKCANENSWRLHSWWLVTSSGPLKRCTGNLKEKLDRAFKRWTVETEADNIRARIERLK